MKKTNSQHHKIISIVLVLIPIIVTACLSLYNYFKAMEYLDADWDGFEILSVIKHHKKIVFVRPVRSPILTFLIPSEILKARIVLILFHISNVLLIFSIFKEISKNELFSFFASFLYGISWWLIQYTIWIMTEFPAIFFLLLSLLTIIKARELRKKDILYTLAGISSGISCLIKPTFLVFVGVWIYLIYRQEKLKKITLFLIPILILLMIEFVADYFFYKNVVAYTQSKNLLRVYTFRNFVYVNTKMHGVSPYFKSVDFLVRIFKESLLGHIDPQRKIIRNFLIDPIYRWSLIPLLPFITIVISWSMFKLCQKWKFSIVFVIIIFVMFLGYNLWIFSKISYPRFRPDLIEYPEYWYIATTYPSALKYFSGHDTRDIFFYPSKKYAIGTIKNNKYFVLFYGLHYQASEDIYKEIKEYADNNLRLIDKVEDGLPIYVYENVR